MFFTSTFNKLDIIEKIRAELDNVEKLKIAVISNPKYDKIKYDNSVFIEDWGIFAPTKSMLSDFKSGKISQSQFEIKYYTMLEKMWDSTCYLIATNAYTNVLFLTEDKSFINVFTNFLNKHHIECKELDI